MDDDGVEVDHQFEAVVFALRLFSSLMTSWESKAALSAIKPPNSTSLIRGATPTVPKLAILQMDRAGLWPAPASLRGLWMGRGRRPASVEAGCSLTRSDFYRS